MSTPIDAARLTLAKDSIDLGIVTNDLAGMTRFYGDVVGLADEGASSTRSSRGGSVRNLRCGTSLIKLVSYAERPAGAAPPGGVRTATGYRYWTIHVRQLEEVVAACERAGRPIVVPIKTVSPGVRIAIVEDPDGNWVEFLHESA
jgi:catechol 2,3-dioxygenase-like lactoylglutathione lyase family enzyme